MSTPPPIAIPFSTDQNIKNLESERSSLDSHHDNQFSRTHWIIQQLYNGRQGYSNEDEFVDYINTDSSIPLDYYPDRYQRLRQKLKGFFTARMECLVNDTHLISKTVQIHLLHLYTIKVHILLTILKML